MTDNQYVDFYDFSQLVRDLRATTKANEKKATLQRVKEGSVAYKLLGMTYNPFYTFYMQNVPAPSGSSEVLMAELAGVMALDLLDSLNQRSLSGNAAKSAVSRFLGMIREDSREAFCRVLQKDLKAGIGDKTINSVFKDYIPIFPVQLAVTLKPGVIEQLVYPVIAEYKYDGERTVVRTRDGAVEYRSRSGFMQEHLLGQFDEDVQALRLLVGEDIVIDAEVMSSSFRALAKSRGANADKSGLTLVAFDIMPASSWDRRESSPQAQRSQFLSQLISNSRLQRVVRSDMRIVNNAVELQAYYDEAIGLGLEGLMIKSMHDAYQFKRANNWWKWKPVNPIDLCFEDFVEGLPGTRFVGSMGAAVMSGYTDDGRFVRTNVNSGFPDSLRQEIWNNREAWRGKCGEVLYDCLTQNEQDAEVWSLRFPRWSKLRSDKTA